MLITIYAAIVALFYALVIGAPIMGIGFMAIESMRRGR